MFANVIPQARMTLQRNTESGCGLRIIGCSNTPEPGCAKSAVLFYTIVVPTQHLAIRLRCVTTLRPGSRVVCLHFAESIAKPPVPQTILKLMQRDGSGKFTESSRWIHVGFTNDSPNGESNLTAVVLLRSFLRIHGEPMVNPT